MIGVQSVDDAADEDSTTFPDGTAISRRMRMHDRLAFAAGLIALVLIALLLALQVEYPSQTADVVFSVSLLGVAALTSLLASVVPARSVRFALLVVAAITSGIMTIYVFPIIVMVLTMISAARTLLSAGWTLEALTVTVLSAGVAGLLVSWLPDIAWLVGPTGVFVMVGGWQIRRQGRTSLGGWLMALGVVVIVQWYVLLALTLALG